MLFVVGEILWDSFAFLYTKYELSYINIYFLCRILNRKETEIFGQKFFIRFARVLSSNMQSHDIRFKNSKSNFSFAVKNN